MLVLSLQATLSLFGPGIVGKLFKVNTKYWELRILKLFIYINLFVSNTWSLSVVNLSVDMEISSILLSSRVLILCGTLSAKQIFKIGQYLL